MSTLIQERKALLVIKEKELQLIKEKAFKGEICGAGVVELIQQVVTEMNQLELEIIILEEWGPSGLATPILKHKPK